MTNKVSLELERGDEVALTLMARSHLIAEEIEQVSEEIQREMIDSEDIFLAKRGAITDVLDGSIYLSIVQGLTHFSLMPEIDFFALPRMSE